MLFITLIILIICKALPFLNDQLPETFYRRISAIILLVCAILTFNTFYFDCIGSGLAIYGGLFYISTISQIMEIFIYLIGAMILIAWPTTKNNSSITNYDSKEYKEYLNNEIEPSILNGVSSVSIPSAGYAKAAAELEKKESRKKTLSTINYSTNYSIIVLFSSLGASLLISSYDLVSMYLSLELQSFSLYVLSTLYRESELSTSAGLKYFLLGGLSSCIILLGAGLIYSFTGLTNFESIYSLISGSEINNIIQGFYLGLIFIFVGFLFKIAAAPLHNWSPDVYDDTPTIVTIWLTIIPKISILLLLLELYTQIGFIDEINSFNIPLIDITDNLKSSIKNLLLISSLLSLIIGSIVGLAQTRIKRLLAYSTISHIGFILLALAINTEQSIDSFLFYIIQYSITNLNIFLIIIALSYVINGSTSQFNINNNNDINIKNFKDIRYISELKGQFFVNPLITLSFSICLFSMAGIPPLIGFFSKQFVLYSAVQSGYNFISFVAIFVSVISAYYYLKIIKVIHLETNEIKIIPSIPSLNKRFAKDNLVKDMDLSSRVFATNSLPKGIEGIAGKEEVIIVESKISNPHSFLISTLTLSILFFIFKPSLILSGTQLLSLSLFNF